MYVIEDPDGRHALVGTGHPASRAALRQALSTRGIDPSDVQRIVALDASVGQLGNRSLFPQADLFVTSLGDRLPDSPVSSTEAYVTRLSDALDAIGEHGADRQAMADAQAQLQNVLREDLAPLRGEKLGGIVVRTGVELALGRRRFRVMELAGPCPGHTVLYERGRALFSHRLVSRRPWADLLVEDALAMVLSLEALEQLDATLLVGATGPPVRGASLVSHTVESASRQFPSLLTNLPLMLREPRTALQVVELDFGYLPADPLRLASTVVTMRAYLEEITRTGAAARTGEGCQATYVATSVTPRAFRG